MPVETVTELPGRGSPRAGAAQAVVYDFRRPTKVSREQVRALQMAGETFARRLATLLTSGLRAVSQVAVTDISQRSYDEYTGALPTPTVIAPLAIAPLPGTGTIQFELSAALAAIDHMLGGPGGAQPVRTLTDIEMSLLSGLLDQIVSVLRYALEPIVDVEPTIGPVEYNPQFVQAAGPAEAMIVIEFALTIGQERSPLSISLPLTPMLPWLDVQRPHDATADGTAARRTAARVREHLAELPLDVCLQFDGLALSSARVLTLAVGDLVPLPHRVGAPLSVHAGGARIARAVAGKSGTRLAALVVEGPGAGASPKEPQ